MASAFTPQTGFGATGSSTTIPVSVTYVSGQASLLVFAWLDTTGAKTITVADSGAVNAYTVVGYGRYVGGTKYSCALVYCPQVAAAGTVTVTGTLNSASTMRAVKPVKVTGQDTTSAAIAFASLSQDSAPGTGANAVTSGVLGTLSSQPAGLFGVSMSHSQGSSITFNASWANGGSFSEFDALEGDTSSMESLHVTATTSLAATWTATNAAEKFINMAVAILDAAGASAATLSSPTPSGTLGTSTTATIGATTDQSTGTLYVVVDSAANLSGVTAAQVKLGEKAAGTAALAANTATVSTTSPSAGVTGLTASTAYSYAAVQNNGNGDSNLVTGTFTTAASGGTAPKTLMLLGVG